MSAEMWRVGEEDNKWQGKRKEKEKETTASCVGGSVGVFIGVMRR